MVLNACCTCCKVLTQFLFIYLFFWRGEITIVMMHIMHQKTLRYVHVVCAQTFNRGWGGYTDLIYRLPVIVKTTIPKGKICFRIMSQFDEIQRANNVM